MTLTVPRILRFAATSVWLLSSTLGLSLAADSGEVRICMASDFEWSHQSSIDLPPRTIFGFAGKLCGDLYQPTSVESDPALMKCYNTPDQRHDEEYKGGAIITTESVVLTQERPCVTATARMFVTTPDNPHYARSSRHEGWLATSVLGYSTEISDDGTPWGQPNGLGPMFDKLELRAQVVRDIAKLFVVTPQELEELNELNHAWQARTNLGSGFNHLDPWAQNAPIGKGN